MEMLILKRQLLTHDMLKSRVMALHKTQIIKDQFKQSLCKICRVFLVTPRPLHVPITFHGHLYPGLMLVTQTGQYKTTYRIGRGHYTPFSYSTRYFVVVLLRLLWFNIFNFIECYCRFKTLTTPACFPISISFFSRRNLSCDVMKGGNSAERHSGSRLAPLGPYILQGSTSGVCRLFPTSTQAVCLFFLT